MDFKVENLGFEFDFDFKKDGERASIPDRHIPTWWPSFEDKKPNRGIIPFDSEEAYKS